MSPFPQCHCHRECISKEVIRGANRGRWYWKCAAQSCNYFEWNRNEGVLYRDISMTPMINKAKKSAYTVKNRIDRTMVKESSSQTLQTQTRELDQKNSRSAQRAKRRSTKPGSDKTEVMLALYTETDICIKTSGRHGVLETILRTIPQVVWQPRLNLWVFSADQFTYQTVMTTLNLHSGSLAVTGLPAAVLQFLPTTVTQLLEFQQKRGEKRQRWQERKKQQVEHQQQQNSLPDHNLNEDDYFDSIYADFDENIGDNACKTTSAVTGSDDYLSDDDLDDLEWMGSLFQQETIKQSILWQSMTSHQRSQMKKGIQLDGNVYLHDTTGSGKSLPALGIALTLQDEWPVLIICSPSACTTWKQTIEKMLSLKEINVCVASKLKPNIQRKQHNTKRNTKPSFRDPDYVYSTNPMAIKARARRQLLRNQKAGLVPGATSTLKKTSQKQLPTLYQGSPTLNESLLYISLEDDSGDNYNDDYVSSRHTKAAPSTYRRNKQPLKEGCLYIDLIDDGGDLYPDKEDITMFNARNTSEVQQIKGKFNETGTTIVSNKGKDTSVNYTEITATTQFVIMSYDAAKTQIGSLIRRNFEVIILDDCHEIKTAMVSNKAAFTRLIDGAKKTIMVSDIVMASKPMESFPLLQFLKPSIFVDYRFFGFRYCGARQTVFGWDYSGTSNEFELQFLLNKTLLIS